MKLNSKTKENIAVLSIQGEFDLSETAVVDKWFDERLREEATRIVVDMSGVTFIDSAGLSSLVYGMKQTRELGGDVYLCGMPAEARLVFELTRLDEVFNIFSDEDEAIAAFAKAKLT